MSAFVNLDSKQQQKELVNSWDSRERKMKETAKFRMNMLKRSVQRGHVQLDLTQLSDSPQKLRVKIAEKWLSMTFPIQHGIICAFLLPKKPKNKKTIMKL
jgi:hypothetical protein